MTGLNSAGKSSVIQSIVLPYQTLLNFPVSEINTNGEYLKLGTVDELVDKVYGRNKFIITLYKKKEDITFQVNIRQGINKLEVSVSSRKEERWDLKAAAFFKNLHNTAGYQFNTACLLIRRDKGFNPFLRY